MATYTFQQGTSGYAGMQDTWITDWSVNTNWGGDDETNLGFESGFGICRALMRWDLSSVSGTITSATLQLYDNDYSSRTQNTPFDIFQPSASNADWTPGTSVGVSEGGAACWNQKARAVTAWAGSQGMSTITTDYINTSLAQYTFLDDASGFKTVTFNADGIAYLQTLIGTTGGGGLFLMCSTESTDNSITKFKSSKDATTVQRPILTIITSESSSSSSSCRSSSSSSSSSSCLSSSSCSSSSSSYSLSTATSFYFSQSTGSNTTGAGTVGNPWQNFKGMKNGTNSLSPGDTCYFKRGDTWVGTNAEVVVNSSGTSTNPIILDAYSTGNDPVFTMADITTIGWLYTGADSIYTLASQSQTHLKCVVQGTDKALARWQGTITTLPEGTFKRSGATLYVRCWNNSNPATSDIRVANYAHSSSVDGARGLISSSRTNGTLGSYVHFKNLKILGANGVGFSSSAASNYFYDCTIIGASNDGVLFYSDLVSTLENANGSQWHRGEIAYSAANGGGNGQGFTSYAPNTYIVDANVHDNFMAGIDFLDFNAQSNVTQCGALFCTVKDNGRWQDAGSSYDPGIYVDGASEVFLYGNIVSGSGTVAGALNTREGIKFGSEHPTTKICENIYIINNLVYNCHWTGIGSDNAGSSLANIKNVYIINNTIIAYQAGTFVMCWNDTDVDPTADNWVIRNNIFHGSVSTGLINLYASAAAFLNSDYNLFYRPGLSSNIYSTDGSVTNYTLATWRTLSGEDANSINSNPLFVTTSDSAPDVHLQDGSPAIDAGMLSAYTIPSWLPANILALWDGAGAVYGTTRPSGAIDDVDVAIDIGYHYLSLDSSSSSSLSSSSSSSSCRSSSSSSSSKSSSSSSCRSSSSSSRSFAYPTILLVQSKSVSTVQNNIAQLTMTSATTSGNFLKIFVGSNNSVSDGGAISVTDNYSNTFYVDMPYDENAASNLESMWSYYAYNITGGADHIITVTCANYVDANQMNIVMTVAEFSGVASTPFDKSMSTEYVGLDSNLNSGTTALITQQDELLCGIGVSGTNATFTPGSEWTEITDSNGVTFAYRVVTTVAGYNFTTTASAAAYWLAGISTFKAGTTSSSSSCSSSSCRSSSSSSSSSSCRSSSSSSLSVSSSSSSCRSSSSSSSSRSSSSSSSSCRSSSSCSSSSSSTSANFGSNKYVLPTGAGTMDGNSFTNAYSASAGGLQTAWDAITEGASVYVGSGAYSNLTLNISTGGTTTYKYLVGVDTGGGVPVFTGNWIKTSPAAGLSFITFQNDIKYVDISNLTIQSYQVVIQNRASGGRNLHLRFTDLTFLNYRNGFEFYGDVNCTASSCPNPTIASNDIIITRCHGTGYTKRHVRFKFGCYNCQVIDCEADAGGSSYATELFQSGFTVGDGSTPDHDITFIDCIARNNYNNAGAGGYWNSDGYTTENQCYNIIYLRCEAYNNTDGGWDCKGKTGFTFTDCIGLLNKRNFRFWTTSATVLTRCLGAYAVFPGGIGTAAGLWVNTNAIVTANNCTFHNNAQYQLQIEGGGTVTFNNSILSQDSTVAATGAIIVLNGGSFTENSSVRYNQGVTGVNPQYVNPNNAYEGEDTDFNNALYGITKGYYNNTLSGLSSSSSSCRSSSSSSSSCRSSSSSCSSSCSSSSSCRSSSSSSSSLSSSSSSGSLSSSSSSCRSSSSSCRSSSSSSSSYSVKPVLQEAIVKTSTTTTFVSGNEAAYVHDVDTDLMAIIYTLNQGFKPARYTTAQRDALTDIFPGLVIFNTTTNKLNVYTTTWEQIS